MADTVAKAQVIERMAEKAGLSKADAESALKAFQEVVTDILAAGDSTTLVGFGTFKVSERAAREGRNPQTGATMHIPAAKVARFSAGKRLKEAVNETVPA
jgi:DNA-binding protein HU-beta